VGWNVTLNQTNIDVVSTQNHTDFGNFFGTPGLQITKTGDTLSKAGDNVTYTFVVTNNGTVDLVALV
jgi:hypothetical protein